MDKKHKLRDLYIRETGNPFPDDVAKYADWLEEKITSTNKPSAKFCTCDMGNRWRVLQSFITNDFIMCPTCGAKLSRIG
jgi:hypothetical protein